MFSNNDRDVRVIVVDDIDFYVVLSDHSVKRQYQREIFRDNVFLSIETCLGDLLNEIRYDDRLTIYDVDCQMSYSAHLRSKGDQFVVTTVVPGKMEGELIKNQKLFIKEDILKSIDYSDYIHL